MTFLLTFLTVLHFWIYFFLLTQVFVLQWLCLHWEILIILLHFPIKLKTGCTISFHSLWLILIDRYATVKLSLINNICVKQQLNIGFFIFKFTPKYMLGILIKYMLSTVYIYNMYNKSILWGRFFPSFQFLCCIWKSLHIKTVRKNFFFNGAISSWFLYIQCKWKNFISINQYILSF